MKATSSGDRLPVSLKRVSLWGGVSSCLQQSVAVGLILSTLSGCSHFMSAPQPLAESVLKLPEAAHRWWTAFHDPVMDALAERLLAQNLDIQLARARLDEVRGLYRSTAASLLPQINARAYVDRGNQQVMTSGPYWVANGGLSASWEVDVFGGRRSALKAADSVVLSKVYALHYAAQLMLAELFQSVVIWRQAQKMLVETVSLLESQEDQVRLFRSRADAGLLDSTYPLRAEAQRAQTATLVHLARATLMQAQYAMERFLGQEPGTLTPLLSKASGELSLPNLPDMAKALAIDLEILRHRPDIEMARYNLLAAEASVVSAESDLWPKVTVGGFFGRQVVSAGLNKLAPAASPNPIWDVVPMIQLPILDFGRIRGAIDGAKAQAKQAAIVYEQTVLTALQEAYTALSDYQHGLDAMAQQESALAYRQLTVELVQDRFHNGVSDMIDLTTAQAELDQATINWVQRKAEAALAYIRLQKAMGLSLLPPSSTSSNQVKQVKVGS